MPVLAAGGSAASGPGTAAVPDSLSSILNTLVTMEYLATTYLTNALANAAALGLTTSRLMVALGTASSAPGTVPPGLNQGQISTLRISGSAGTVGIQQRTGIVPSATFVLAPLDVIRAALVEEQDHAAVLQMLGATPTTTTFSLPSGPTTLSDFATFVNTLITLETTCIASYLTALLEVAALGRPDLAQLMGRLAGVESEHRVGARTMTALAPPNNASFEDTPFASMAEVVAAVRALGFLSPTAGNSFTFPGIVPVDATGVTQRFP